MNPRKPHKDEKANSLWTLRDEQGGLEKFSDAHPLEVEQASVGRYIDASAIPLESSKEGRSDDFLDGSDDCT